jgi:hypothetical protein
MTTTNEAIAALTQKIADLDAAVATGDRLKTGEAVAWVLDAQAQLGKAIAGRICEIFNRRP